MYFQLGLSVFLTAVTFLTEATKGREGGRVGGWAYFGSQLDMLYLGR